MRYVPDGMSIHLRLYLIELNRYPPTYQELFPYLPPFEFSEALNLMHIRRSDTHFRLHTDRLTL